jgi:hypothetical protein
VASICSGGRHGHDHIVVGTKLFSYFFFISFTFCHADAADICWRKLKWNYWSNRGGKVRVINLWCFNTTFKNISFRLWRSVLLGWPSWSWSYSSCYLCNQCLSPLKLWVRIPLMGCVLNTTLCDHQVCQWLATGQWLSTGIPVSSTNKTDRHNLNVIYQLREKTL